MNSSIFMMSKILAQIAKIGAPPKEGHTCRKVRLADGQILDHVEVWPSACECKEWF